MVTVGFVVGDDVGDDSVDVGVEEARAGEVGAELVHQDPELAVEGPGHPVRELGACRAGRRVRFPLVRDAADRPHVHHHDLTGIQKVQPLPIAHNKLAYASLREFLPCYITLCHSLVRRATTGLVNNPSIPRCLNAVNGDLLLEDRTSNATSYRSSISFKSGAGDFTVYHCRDANEILDHLTNKKGLPVNLIYLLCSAHDETNEHLCLFL